MLSSSQITNMKYQNSHVRYFLDDKLGGITEYLFSQNYGFLAPWSFMLLSDVFVIMITDTTSPSL
jgi:hypothetical protein